MEQRARCLSCLGQDDCVSDCNTCVRVLFSPTRGLCGPRRLEVCLFFSCAVVCQNAALVWREWSPSFQTLHSSLQSARRSECIRQGRQLDCALTSTRHLRPSAVMTGNVALSESPCTTTLFFPGESRRTTPYFALWRARPTTCTRRCERYYILQYAPVQLCWIIWCSATEL